MLLAPNGKKSNLNEVQHKLVRTPEFISWFGDWINSPETASKVVDENGEPLVVFHRTDNKFTIFDKEKLGNQSGWRTAYFGFYFSNHNEKGSYGKKVIKVFLNIKNPYKIKSETYSDFDYDYKNFDSNNFIKNDGIEIKVERLVLDEKSDKHFVAFEPNQIKIADGTNTTFDGSNPDIRFDKGGSLNDDDKDEIYSKWKGLVNMSFSELEKFYNTQEGKEAGLSSTQANELGINSGRESARWIMKMKKTNRDEWTPTMWGWAKRQTSFISRMSGNKGKLLDDKGNKTRKHTSLLIWGHNPLKKQDGGDIDFVDGGSVYSNPSNENMDNYTLEVKKEIESNGYFVSNVSYSKTDFGNSNYLYVSKDKVDDFSIGGLKVRISDHSVTNRDRMFNEIHLHYPPYKGLLGLSRALKDIDFSLNRKKYFKEEDGIEYYKVRMEANDKDLRQTDKILSTRLSSGRRGASRTIYNIERENKKQVTNFIDIRDGKIFTSIDKFENGGDIGDNEYSLDIYYVDLNTERDSECIYHGIDKSDAEAEYNNPSIPDSMTYGVSKSLQIQTNTYKFVYELDSEYETIEDFPINEYYEDKSVYELIDEGYREDLKSDDIETSVEESEREEKENVESLETGVKDYVKSIAKEWKNAAFLGSTFYALVPYLDGFIQFRVSDHFFKMDYVNLGRNVTWEENESINPNWKNEVRNIYGFISIHIIDSNSSYYKDNRDFISDFKYRRSKSKHPDLIGYLTYDVSDSNVSEIYFENDINSELDDIKHSIDSAMEEGVFDKKDEGEFEELDYKDGGQLDNFKFEITPNHQTPNVPVIGDVNDFIKNSKNELDSFLEFAKSVSGAVGLSANQVTINSKPFLVRVFAYNSPLGWKLIINPKIDKYVGDKNKFDEGCLSHKGKIIVSERSYKVVVSYYDIEGKKVSDESHTGYYARVWQHEVDHLNGVKQTVEKQNLIESLIYEDGGELGKGKYSHIGKIQDETETQFKINGQWYHKSIVLPADKQIMPYKQTKKINDLRFYSDCVGYPVLSDLEEIIDNEKEIKYDTFIENVNKEDRLVIEQRLGYSRDFPITKDWHVRFFKSKDEDNNTVYFIRHSAIEYVFSKKGGGMECDFDDYAKGGLISPNGKKSNITDGTNTNFDVGNTDIRFDDGGQVLSDDDVVEQLRLKQRMRYLISLLKYKATDESGKTKEDLFIERVVQLIYDGKDFKSKTSIETIAEKEFGFEDKRKVRELTEYAVLFVGREISKKYPDVKEAYYKMVSLYSNQPYSTHRTSTSVELGQFSTPVPMAYLMGVYVGINEISDKTFFEPCAGNGALTISGNPKNFVVNELDMHRYNNLIKENYKLILNQDANKKFNFDYKFDGLLANPPFATTKSDIVADGFHITGLEQQIIVHSLTYLKDKAKIAFIIGGHTEFDTEGRIRSKKDRAFLSYLFKKYYLDDVINVNGTLYGRQGTTYPIRIILIAGKKSVAEGFYPLEDKDKPLLEPFSTKVVDTFDELFKRTQKYI